jgi:hypothetical protein
MQIEETKNAIHLVARGWTTKANRPRIKPGHIPSTGGYGELALRGGWGSLGSVAKKFSLRIQKKVREKRNDPDLGFPLSLQDQKESPLQLTRSSPGYGEGLWNKPIRKK